MRSTLGRLLVVLLVLSALTATLAGCGTSAAPYPEKAITLVVPYSAGGISDTMARALGEAGKAHLSQSIVVENRVGGSAVIGTNEVVTAKADGYTLLYGSTSELASALHLTQAPYTTESYDVLMKIGSMRAVLAVPKNSPFNTLQDVIDFAKANPGKLKAGNPGNGTVVHLTGESFASSVGIEITFVPFQGSGALITAVLGEHVDLGFLNVPEAMPHKESGEMRVLAVFAEKRSTVMPDVPTAKEAGFDVVGGAMHYIVGPKGIPAGVRQAIIDKFTAIANDQKFVDIANKLGYEVGLKSGEDGLKEIVNWYQVSGDIYTRLGMKK